MDRWQQCSRNQTLLETALASLDGVWYCVSAHLNQRTRIKLYLMSYYREMPPFNQIWLLFTWSEVSEPHPLLWWASVLHPAENAAGCHGSSAGTGEGGARLQLRLPPDEHQHPGRELWPHRAHLHHHLCRTVLPRGNRPSPPWRSTANSDVLPMVHQAFTLFHLFLGVADRILSTSTIMTGQSRRSATVTGPMRWNTLRGVQWRSATQWGPIASAPRATQGTRTAVALMRTCPAACPFEMPAFMCQLCNYIKQISIGLWVFVSHLQSLVSPRPFISNSYGRQRDDWSGQNQRGDWNTTLRSSSNAAKENQQSWTLSYQMEMKIKESSETGPADSGALPSWCLLYIQKSFSRQKLPLWHNVGKRSSYLLSHLAFRFLVVHLHI